MKLITWNVNGIQACVRKGFLAFLREQKADVYCIQEVKSSPELLHLPLNLEGYYLYSFPAQKKGYSGVATISKHEPMEIIRGIGNKEIDREGRVLTLDFNKFYLVNTYFPHAHRELKRLQFKLHFNELFAKFCRELEIRKPVVIAGDLNVAQTETDLANPKQNDGNAGFTNEEREWIHSFLDLGHVDAFRLFNEAGGNYTWWPYYNNLRERNIGWRIDSFLVSKIFQKELISCSILSDVKGSDHCPVILELR